MELPQVERVRSKIHEEVGRSSGRGGGSVDIRWKQTAETGAKLEALLCYARISGQHLCSIKSAYFAPRKCLTIIKDIIADVISIRPYTQFGVVIELGAIAEGIAIVCASCI